MACSRHILNNNVGISRDVLYHELADGTDVKIEQISCRRSGDEPDGLALIKSLLRVGGRVPGQQEEKASQYNSFHFDLRYETVSQWQKILRRPLFVISSAARNLDPSHSSDCAKTGMFQR